MLGGVGLREQKVRGFKVAFVLAFVVIIRSCYYLRDDSHGLMSTQHDLNSDIYLRRLFQLILQCVRNVLSYGSL